MNPAYAGMDLSASLYLCGVFAEPRTRGDGPVLWGFRMGETN